MRVKRAGSASCCRSELFGRCSPLEGVSSIVISGATAREHCGGLAVFDLESGEMVQWVRIEGVVRELYDVAVLPGIRRPAAIGFKTDEVKRVISIEE